MPRRLLRCFLLLLLLVPGGRLLAEKVADLPLPHSYVNDFAGVLSAGETQTLEDVCRQLHQNANADVAVVTIKTLDDGQSIEEFTGQLEEKWKLGKKGQDRSAIYVLVTGSRKMRVEVGYGLEGVLNDAKVGRFLDQATPAAKQGDWDQAAQIVTEDLAQAVAADAHVSLSSSAHQYHWQNQRQSSQAQGHLGFGQIAIGVIFIGILILLVATGNIGWAWMLLWSVMGGGGGGGRDDDDRGGGGFGGMGGGASGGGGASRDF